MSDEYREKPACSTVNSAFPEEIKCPYCNGYVEIWSDETDISCTLCGKMFANTLKSNH